MTRSPYKYEDDRGAARGALKRLRRLYYLISGLYWLATALPMPILVLLQRTRGMDLFEVGVLMAIFSITTVALEVPTGGLADAWGRPRVSVAALLVMALSMAVLTAAGSFPVLAFSFVLYGAGRALMSGALEAWFVDEVLRLGPEEELQRSLAYGNTAALVALSLAGLLGGLLPQLASEGDLPGGLTGLALPTAASALLFVLTAVLTYALVARRYGDRGRRPDVAAGTTGAADGEAGAAGDSAAAGIVGPTPGTSAIVRAALRETVRNRTLLLLAALGLIAGAAISTMETFWQPFFADTLGGGTPTLLFGIITAGNFMLAMGGNLISTPLTRFLGGRPARFAALAQAMRGIFLLLFAAQYSMGPAVGMFWCAYMMVGATESPHQTLINRNVRTEHRSAMLSVQSLAVSLGAFAGSALFGLVAQGAGLRTVWIVTGAYLVVSLILYLRVDTRESRSEYVQYVPAEANAGATGS